MNVNKEVSTTNIQFENPKLSEHQKSIKSQIDEFLTTYGVGKFPKFIESVKAGKKFDSFDFIGGGITGDVFLFHKFPKLVVKIVYLNYGKKEKYRSCNLEISAQKKFVEFQEEAKGKVLTTEFWFHTVVGEGKKFCCFVFERLDMNGGDLCEILVGKKQAKSEKENCLKDLKGLELGRTIFSYLLSMAENLLWLDGKNIKQCDAKLENSLIQFDEKQRKLKKVVICDFGHNNNQTITSFLGSMMEILCFQKRVMAPFGQVKEVSEFLGDASKNETSDGGIVMLTMKDIINILKDKYSKYLKQYN